MDLIPKGNEDFICKLKGHQWKTIFCHDREYRFCRRCEREERKEYLGFGMNMWVVNEVKPTSA